MLSVGLSLLIHSLSSGPPLQVMDCGGSVTQSFGCVSCILTRPESKRVPRIHRNVSAIGELRDHWVIPRR